MSFGKYTRHLINEASLQSRQRGWSKLFSQGSSQQIKARLDAHKKKPDADFQKWLDSNHHHAALYSQPKAEMKPKAPKETKAEKEARGLAAWGGSGAEGTAGKTLAIKAQGAGAAKVYSDVEKKKYAAERGLGVSSGGVVTAAKTKDSPLVAALKRSAQQKKLKQQMKGSIADKFTSPEREDDTVEVGHGSIKAGRLGEEVKGKSKGTPLSQKDRMRIIARAAEKVNKTYYDHIDHDAQLSRDVVGDLAHSLDIKQKIRMREESNQIDEVHIDPSFVATFGVAAGAYDHIVNPLIKKAKQKIADKMAEKLAKKNAPAEQQVAEGVKTLDQDSRKHSKWWVRPKSRKQFGKEFPLSKEKEAHEHAMAIGGSVHKMDQYGSVIKEEAEQSHKVSVTISNPNHAAVSMRKEKSDKKIVVKASTKEEAVAKAKAFYQKKGYKVHDAEYHSVVKEEVDLEEARKIPMNYAAIKATVMRRNAKLEAAKKAAEKKAAAAVKSASKKNEEEPHLADTGEEGQAKRDLAQMKRERGQFGESVEAEPSEYLNSKITEARQHILNKLADKMGKK